MKVKELLEQLNNMNPEVDVIISINVGNAEEHEYYEILYAREHNGNSYIEDDHHVQIRGC